QSSVIIAVRYARPALSIASARPTASCTCALSQSRPVRPRGVFPAASSISASMPARAIPVMTALWWGPSHACAGNAYEIPGQRLHWLSSGTPARTIVRRAGRQPSPTAQPKLPVPRRHGGAGGGDVGPVPVDLLDALVRQPERDELGDVVVAEIPADGAGALGQQLHDAQIGQQIGLQAAKLTRPHEPVEAGGMEL